MTTTNCCDAEFSGVNTCHCAGCHHTFPTVVEFDKHRTGPAHARRCVDHPRDTLNKQGRTQACRPRKSRGRVGVPERPFQLILGGGV